MEIKYIELDRLINQNKKNVDIIKNSYLLLLSQLTTTNFIETELFLNNVEKISEMGVIIVGYIGDINDINFEIVANGTIIIEPKIIRDCKNVGHIEDIVVIKKYRGLGIAQKILELLKRIARKNNCYKITLDCDYKIKKVYLKNGLNVKGLQMTEYFYDNA